MQGIIRVQMMTAIAKLSHSAILMQKYAQNKKREHPQQQLQQPTEQPSLDIKLGKELCDERKTYNFK